jgi:hypothetical protein
MNPYRPTVMAIDFDRTFTSDVDFWRLFIRQAVTRGHTVLCVTGRTDTPYSRAELANVFGSSTFSLLTCCIFCNHSPKRAAAQRAGYRVDIWIDDLPEGVGATDPKEFKKLEDQFDVCEMLPVFHKGALDAQAVWRPDLDIQKPLNGVRVWNFDGTTSM